MQINARRTDKRHGLRVSHGTPARWGFLNFAGAKLLARRNSMTDLAPKVDRRKRFGNKLQSSATKPSGSAFLGSGEVEEMDSVMVRKPEDKVLVAQARSLGAQTRTKQKTDGGCSFHDVLRQSRLIAGAAIIAVVIFDLIRQLLGTDTNESDRVVVSVAVAVAVVVAAALLYGAKLLGGTHQHT